MYLNNSVPSFLSENFALVVDILENNFSLLTSPLLLYM